MLADFSYKRYSKVVGVTFNNRQNYVKNCNAGDVLTLQREKNNAYDRNAIAVYHKGKIGRASCRERV